MNGKQWKWKLNLKSYFERKRQLQHKSGLFTDKVIYEHSAFRFLPKLLISAAGFLLCWGVQGALLQGSREQRWSSMQPRWPWQIMFINLSCSSSDSIYWKQCEKYFMKSGWTALNESLKPQWHNRTEHTVIGLEQLGWEGTCRWLDDTGRCFLFLSGVLPVTWWLKIPGSWEKSYIWRRGLLITPPENVLILIQPDVQYLVVKPWQWHWLDIKVLSLFVIQCLLMDGAC